MPKITFEIDIKQEEWDEFHENSLLCHDQTGAKRLRELILVDNIRHKTWTPWATKGADNE